MSMRSLSFALALALSPLGLAACTGGSSVDVELGVTDQGLMVGTLDGEPVCAGDLAATVFPHALCVCGDFGTASALSTETFHSGGLDVDNRAGIGVGGEFVDLGQSTVDGPVTVGDDYVLTGDHDIHGVTHVGGDIEVTGDIFFGDDVFVAGDFTGIQAEVEGEVHQPASSDLGWFIDAEDVSAEAVEVTPPCACDPDELMDIAGWIAEAAEDNDNESVGLQADALDDVDARGKELSLPAGRYFVDDFDARGPVTLRLDGPTALYIDGDLRSSSLFKIELETDEAELNLFVGGDIIGTGVFHLGSKEAPGRVRTYVAGEQDIVLLGDLEIGGELYAPLARLVAAGPLDLVGAVLVGDLVELGRVDIRFDAAVLEAGQTCE